MNDKLIHFILFLKFYNNNKNEDIEKYIYHFKIFIFRYIN